MDWLFIQKCIHVISMQTVRAMLSFAFKCVAEFHVLHVPLEILMICKYTGAKLGRCYGALGSILKKTF